MKSPSKPPSIPRKIVDTFYSPGNYNANSYKPLYQKERVNSYHELSSNNNSLNQQSPQKEVSKITSFKSISKSNKNSKSDGSLNFEKETIFKNLINDQADKPNKFPKEPIYYNKYNINQNSILDKSLPKFHLNESLTNNNEKKKFEPYESFISVISNDSRIVVNKIRGMNFAENPFDKQKISIKIEDFELGKCLGKGRFGKVFIAREKKTRTIYALKIFNLKLMDKSAKELVTREIKIHCYLSHINILKFYGFFNDQIKLYFILEFAAQGSLFSEMKRQQLQRFDESTTALYLKQVIEAVKYLHSNFIIHRDIKPENILLSFGLLKLADFGWSIYAPESKRETFCGTLDYVAPEIVVGDPYDCHVDIWSIGILCYELVTGNPPFESKQEREIFKKILAGKINFPHYVSYDCRDFIEGILQQEPKKRFGWNQIEEHPWLKKNCFLNYEGWNKSVQMFRIELEN